MFCSALRLICIGLHLGVRGGGGEFAYENHGDASRWYLLESGTASKGLQRKPL